MFKFKLKIKRKIRTKSKTNVLNIRKQGFRLHTKYFSRNINLGEDELQYVKW